MAFWIYGSIYDYTYVTNPNNMLNENYSYSVLQYKYPGNSKCPIGDTSPYPRFPNNYCKENDSGQPFSGWAIVDLGSYNYTTLLQFSASELNIGCFWIYCDSNTGYKIFTTSSTTLSNFTDWEYEDICNIENNAQEVICNVMVNKTMRYYFVARYQGGDARPDPAIHFARAYR
jgi:hypothetical protein